MVLAPKGRLEQPLDSSLRGLGWKLSFKDIYATGRLEFKIGACVAPHCRRPSNKRGERPAPLT